MQIKILDYKTYNSIGHLSKSRLGDGDHFIDKRAEDRLTVSTDDGSDLVIVQEKLDGSNVCVVRLNGDLVALGRNGYRCIDSNYEQHRMFAEYVDKHRDKFDKLLTGEHDRVVGEWLAQAHGIKYPRIEDPFVAFDLYRNKIQVNFITYLADVLHAGFKHPRIVHMGGACNGKKALKMLAKLTPDYEAEGVIYRLECNGVQKLIAKLVNQTKVDGLYLPNKFVGNVTEVWNWRP